LPPSNFILNQTILYSFKILDFYLNKTLFFNFCKKKNFTKYLLNFCLSKNIFVPFYTYYLNILLNLNQLITFYKKYFNKLKKITKNLINISNYFFKNNKLIFLNNLNFLNDDFLNFFNQFCSEFIYDQFYYFYYFQKNIYESTINNQIIFDKEYNEFLSETFSHSFFNNLFTDNKIIEENNNFLVFIKFIYFTNKKLMLISK